MPIRSPLPIALLAVVGLAAACGSARADWYSFWDRVRVDFHRNNCWPHPFREIDRRAAQAPFGAMVYNGWRRQNTLGDHYFHPETQVLNEAGEHKIHWILTQAPEQYRAVFVYQPRNVEDAEVRLDSVHQAIAQMLPDQPMPSVIPTRDVPPGWPADYIDTIDRKVQASIPDPRLPKFQAAGAN